MRTGLRPAFYYDAARFEMDIVYNYTDCFVHLAAYHENYNVHTDNGFAEYVKVNYKDNNNVESLFEWAKSIHFVNYNDNSNELSEQIKRAYNKLHYHLNSRLNALGDIDIMLHSYSNRKSHLYAISEAHALCGVIHKGQHPPFIHLSLFSELNEDATSIICKRCSSKLLT